MKSRQKKKDLFTVDTVGEQNVGDKEYEDSEILYPIDGTENTEDSENSDNEEEEEAEEEKLITSSWCWWDGIFITANFCCFLGCVIERGESHFVSVFALNIKCSAKLIGKASLRTEGGQHNQTLSVVVVLHIYEIS